MDEWENPKLVAISSGMISYLEAGRGEPLVFLHGIGSAARSWRHQIAALSDRRRVVAWNAPGYAHSTPPKDAVPTAADYAVALNELLRTLHIDRCHLVGHSLGTLMAARFAADFGAERLLSLTLCGASGGQGKLPAEQRKAMLDERLDDLARLGARGMAEKRGPRLLGPHATPAMIREVVEIQADAVRVEGYERAARMLANADIFADVQRFPSSLRVQIVYGEDDAITPPAINIRIAEACRAPAHAVARAGHALYLENPDRVNALIAAFVDARPEASS
jgi:pimeloyl-ACP methyl ester carboxylesterase